MVRVWILKITECLLALGVLLAVEVLAGLTVLMAWAAAGTWNPRQ